MHLTNHKSQRWSTSVQTIFMPILSQKRIKPTKNCLEAVNSFVSVYVVKMCHNPMNLNNHRSQRWIQSVQTTLIPILFQKRIKTAKKLLRSTKQLSQCFYSQNVLQSNVLIDYMSQRQIRSVQTTIITILSQKWIKPTKNCLETVNNFVSVYLVKMCHNLMHLTNCKS